MTTDDQKKVKALRDRINNGDDWLCKRPVTSEMRADFRLLANDTADLGGYTNEYGQAANDIGEGLLDALDAADVEHQRQAGELAEMNEWIDQIYEAVGGRQPGMTLAEVVKTKLREATAALEAALNIATTPSAWETRVRMIEEALRMGLAEIGARK